MPASIKEVFLSGVEVQCGICSKCFLVCSRCWRGQKYCSKECSKEARRRSNQKAQKKYLESKKGKFKQSELQSKHRVRLKSGTVKKIVSEHSSNVQQRSVINISENKKCLFCKRLLRQIIDNYNYGEL